MRKAMAWFAANHVAANLLMLFVVLGGVITAFTIKVEVFPETSLDSISISVEYPGASPAEVEESVIRRIEEKVAGLAGIRRMDSVAREGTGSITLEVLQGWDLQKLLDEVKGEVDNITTLPDEAEKPVVREITRRVQVLWVALYGDVPEATLKSLAEKAQEEITNLPEVTQAELFGVRNSEIAIEISEDTLRRHGLTLSGVAAAVRQASLDLPAGRIKTPQGDVLVRAKGRRYHATEYRDVAVLTKPDGSKLTLGEIAHLRDGFEDSDLLARFQGKPAALVQVYRVANQNALTVADQVKDYLDELRPTLPAGVNAGVFGDRSVILKSRLNLLLRNMAMGLILVAVVLGLFLELRLAFWVTMGIPVSFCFGLWILPPLDVSINMISLFAFILVLGIVVDDAIVVGENIFRKREEGQRALPAAVEGSTEVGPPVIFSVLTTVVAFAPMMIGTGTMGKIMMNIPLVVCAVLVGSLLESLFVLPAHLARTRTHLKARQEGEPPEPRRQSWITRQLNRLINGPYARLLDWCLKWRYATLAVGIAALLLSLGTFTGGWLKFTLFPKVESDMLTANITMPAGTPLSHTTRVAGVLEDRITQVTDKLDQKRAQDAPHLLEYTVSLVGVLTGGRGPHGGAPEIGSHVATVFVQLLEGEKRDVNAIRVANLWRRAVGQLPDVVSLNFQGEIFSPGNPVEVHLSAADHDELIKAVDRLKTELRGFPGVFDIADSFLPGKSELQLGLLPSARALGLTLDDLARQVRHSFYGAEALRLVRDKDEVKVMIRYPEERRQSLGDIESMRIRTPDGYETPFHQVANAQLVEGYSTINRSQRRRVVKVTADVDPKVTNAGEVRKALTKTVLPRLRQNFPNLRYDMEGEAREERESLADIQQGMIIALFGIYILLAIPFKSFSQPLLVMLAIPFGIVGALLGHLLMGHELSLMSLMGMVGLAGVVVNDSLVLIFRANTVRAQGMTADEAIRAAAPHRFRAIMLTSVTTFAGLTPILLERSLQAQFLIPMAISLGFGVLCATGITLLLIPAGYLILEDIKRQFMRLATWLGIPLREDEETLAHD